MPTGMEMMMNSLLKAAGFDPAIIAKNIGDTVQQFQKAAESVQAQLTAISEQQAQIQARLERIEVALSIRTEDTQQNGNVPALRM